MGFFDSFKTGVGAFVGGFGDFVSDITGAALAAAPTLIPLLQSTGVIPSVQPSPIVTSRGPGAGPLGRMARGTALPGGFVVPFDTTPRVNPTLRNQPLALPPGPFPTGAPTARAFSPSGVVTAEFEADRGGFSRFNGGGGMPAFQSTRGGFVNVGLDLPFIDIVGQGGGGTLARLTSPFVPTMAGARAQPFIANNPVTGALTWFKPAGRPILWSGDLTACKRVAKIASRARRSTRKR